MQRFWRKYKNYFYVLADVFFVLAGFQLVILFTANQKQFLFQSSIHLNAAIINYLIYLLFMIVAKMYRNIWIYAGTQEYLNYSVVCLSAFAVACVLTSIKPEIFVEMRLIILADLLMFLFMLCFRALTKAIFIIYRNHTEARNKMKKTRLLIIGAGMAGNALIREFQMNPACSYEVVGLIDDDPVKRNFFVSGIKILGGRNDIESICKEYDVEEIVLAIPSISVQSRSVILEICSRTHCKVKMLPTISEFIDINQISRNVREVEVEDLLGREPITLNVTSVSKTIKGKTVLVTGGGGSIGSELCRQIVQYEPSRLIVLDIYENNAYDIENEIRRHFPAIDLQIAIASVRDMKRMRKVFAMYHPDIIFHAAAHKHVPLMENNPSEAVKNNIMGTLNTVRCADEFNAKKFVLISTDKAVNPTNVMGATKRLCEMIIQQMNEHSKTDFVAVRFGNVLGSNGSVIPLFKKQIQEGGPVTITHKEITRFFMTIPEAVQLVLEASSFANGGEIYVLDMGKPVKIYDLAVNLIRMSGYEVNKDIKIQITGLRPGEKLFEELLMEEEGLKSTKHNKIYVAKPLCLDYNIFKNKLSTLLETVDSYDDIGIRHALQSLVPTYQCKECAESQELSVVDEQKGNLLSVNM